MNTSFSARWIAFSVVIALFGCSKTTTVATPSIAKATAASIEELGCEQVYADQRLSGLDPAYAIQRCQNFSGDMPNRAMFQGAGCLAPSYISNVIFKDNLYQLISTPSDFQAVFAPIESLDEALSYVLATTDYETYSLFFHGKDAVSTIPPSIDGYVVRVYYTSGAACGCETRTVYAVDVQVTPAGEVEEIGREPIKQVELCID